eukprot:593471-Prymnesium_polylepis.1
MAALRRAQSEDAVETANEKVEARVRAACDADLIRRLEERGLLFTAGSKLVAAGITSEAELGRT